MDKQDDKSNAAGYWFWAGVLAAGGIAWTLDAIGFTGEGMGFAAFLGFVCGGIFTWLVMRHGRTT